MTPIFILLSLIPFYLIGTFPTGVLVAKYYGVDITTKGSGNVGATNVSRVVGKKAGILTLVGDLLKGGLAVALALFLGRMGWYPAFAGIAVVCGHCFSLPPYLRGGKGVATSLGVIVTLSPLLALSGLLIFCTLFYFKRIVSLSSISAAVGVPLVALSFGYPDFIIGALVPISIIIIYRHRENLDRIVKGTEPTMSFSKKETSSK